MKIVVCSKNKSKNQAVKNIMNKFFDKFEIIPLNSTGDEISNIGTNGVLTHGAYTKTDEFMDSILCVISSEYKMKTN